MTRTCDLLDQVLNSPIPSPYSPGETTIREYLMRLLLTLWQEGESFSGKRPFGNSGWEWDVIDALHVAGFIEKDDIETGTVLIEKAIMYLGGIEE